MAHVRQLTDTRVRQPCASTRQGKGLKVLSGAAENAFLGPVLSSAAKSTLLCPALRQRNRVWQWS